MENRDFKFYFAVRMAQLPESLSALQMPRMASRAMVENNSPIEVSRAWGKSAVQLPVNSCFCPSTVARQVPLHPVENFCADHVPRKTVLSRPSPRSRCLTLCPLKKRVLPSNCLQVRPVVVRALQLERCDCSLKACFSGSPAETSIARTQPTKPWDVLTMYYVCCPTASARE